MADQDLEQPTGDGGPQRDGQQRPDQALALRPRGARKSAARRAGKLHAEPRGRRALDLALGHRQPGVRICLHRTREPLPLHRLVLVDEDEVVDDDGESEARVEQWRAIEQLTLQREARAAKKLDVRRLRKRHGVRGAHRQDGEAQLDERLLRPHHVTRDGLQREPSRHPLRDPQVVVEVGQVALGERRRPGTSSPAVLQLPGQERPTGEPHGWRLAPSHVGRPRVHD